MLVPKTCVKFKEAGFTIPKNTSTIVTTERKANTFQINAVCDLACDIYINFFISDRRM